MKTALSEEEEKFCSVYARCFDGAKAYAGAFGCDFESARSGAEQLLSKESIRNRIRALKKARFEKEMVDADDIIGMYIKIAFADLSDFLDFGKKTEIAENGEETSQNEVNLKENPKADTAAISSITSSKGSVKITFYDRMKALEWLGKHLGIGEESEETEGGVVIVPDVEKTKREITQKNKDE